MYARFGMLLMHYHAAGCVFPVRIITSTHFKSSFSARKGKGALVH